jgi:hypothetical protein
MAHLNDKDVLAALLADGIGERCTVGGGHT